VLGDAGDDVSLRVLANFYLEQIHHFRGDYARAVHALGVCVDSLTENTVNDSLGVLGLPSVLSRAWRAWTLSELARCSVSRGGHGLLVGQGRARHERAIVNWPQNIERREGLGDPFRRAPLERRRAGAVGHERAHMRAALLRLRAQVDDLLARTDRVHTWAWR